MAIIDVVKWDEETYAKYKKNGETVYAMDEIFAWRFPENELSTWTQLIVHESQEAVLFRAGAMDGPFAPGRHVLKTENLPVLKELLNLPFGRSPFTAEVWYTNRAIPLNIPWETTEPIRLLDPQFKVAVPVLANGQYAIQIENSRKFLVKLVGTLNEFNKDKLIDYFRGMILTIAKTTIARKVAEGGDKNTVLNISTELLTISNSIEIELRKVLEDFGVRLVNFYVNHIDVDQKDTSVLKLQNALARKAEMNIVGFNYQQERSFNAMEGATGYTGAHGNAENNFQNNPADGGIQGAIMGAGIGFGLGMPLGNAMGSQMGQMTQQIEPPINKTKSGSEAGGQTDMTQKMKFLKELASLRDDGILSDEEFQIEKRKILSM
jgi:membrane protease subunit (stomatin/prohibitin family)